MTPDPQKRPTLLEIIASPFIDLGIVPPFIPLAAHDSPPDFRYITRPMSIINLAKLKKAALLDDEQVTSIAVPSAPQDQEQPDKAKNMVTSTIAQQEMEFQKAVQPGSPISALLSSARQPLVMSTTNTTKESPLFRKLQAAKEAKSSPLRRVRSTRGLQDIEEEEPEAPRGTREKNHDLQRQKELESQKARIVAQMAPVSGLGTRTDDEQENRPLKDSLAKGRARESRKEAPVEAPADLGPQLKLSGFDAAAQTLTLAFDAKAVGRLFRDPREDINLPDERVFIVSWVDYCNKYGMGYALTDGSVGVHFNDSTTLVLAADKQ